MPLSKIISIAVASRIVFLLFAIGATFVIPLDKGWVGSRVDPTAPYVAWIWANFDGEHFIKIAQEGYSATNFAYFPLYPILIFLTQKVIPISPIYIGIGVSFIAFLAATLVIYKIAKIDYSEKISKLSVVLLSFFPLSFFYHSVYTDSLFLLVSTLSFYFARKKNWVFCGIFGALATLDRFSGIALVPALIIEWYSQNKGKLQKEFSKLFVASVLTMSGLLLYMFYLKTFFGDPLLFQKAMSAWGQNQIVFPPIVLLRYLRIFLTVDKGIIVYWIAVLEFVSFILYFALSFYVYKRIRKSYGVFMFIIVTLVSFTGTFAGTPRYLLHLFPAFLGMAVIFEKNKILRFLILAIFLILGFLLTGLFTRGYFVA